MYRCPSCDLAFAKFSSANAHMRNTGHGEAPTVEPPPPPMHHHDCGACGRRFAAPAALKRHVAAAHAATLTLPPGLTIEAAAAKDTAAAVQKHL